ncbi:MAG: PfkB family carbohydrate kinase [Klebsiella huaxiensis]|uniref:PfkB family carbohydrate kinase n=1 Tax=Klebsiella huaxiensis TaxID=2153354 RepID=UPI0026EA9E3F|nr:PfkB family carbohydrate kinase [Klebsiella huaxiensis]WEJ88564.1 MAG: PfkB family carbohydrate kinase [Klebsiella huaxiensis]
MTITADRLSPQRPIVVIGAAFGDLILHLDTLPQSGSDVSASDGGRQIGGCAFNVARALARLGLAPVNAIPVGNGDWGQAVAQKMAQESLPVILRHPTHDNGWCLALVEANKERTFITVEGCEQHWSTELLAQIPQPKDAIIYVSGYELASEMLRQWILGLTEDKTLFVDFGPRLCDMDIDFIQALLRKRPVLTLNRDELSALSARLYHQENATLESASRLVSDWQLRAICRFDKDGAWVVEPNAGPQHIPACRVEVHDTIAAGDSHCAGTIAGLACGMNLRQATLLGNEVAAIVVSRPGSDGAPTRQELRQFQLRQENDR